MATDILLGAIAGDIIGSFYEFDPMKSIDFPLFNGSSSHFTDDTIMTIANADWLLTGDSLLVLCRIMAIVILVVMVVCFTDG